MSLFSRLRGSDGKTSVKAAKGGIFKSRLLQSIVAPHTIVRNIINRNKPMSAKETALGFLGF